MVRPEGAFLFSCNHWLTSIYGWMGKRSKSRIHRVLRPALAPGRSSQALSTALVQKTGALQTLAVVYLRGIITELMQGHGRLEFIGSSNISDPRKPT